MQAPITEFPSMTESSPRGYRIDPIENVEFGRSRDCDTARDGVRETVKTVAGLGPAATNQSALDADKRVATDGGIPMPTQTGYRILWVLAGQSRTPEALRSEVSASFDCEMSLQSIRRTCRSLAESDLARATGRDDGTRQYVITARGRHVAYGELAGALDHVDLSSAMATVGRRIATGETDDALPPRKTTLRGSRPADMPFGTPDKDADEDVRTDGGEDLSITAQLTGIADHVHYNGLEDIGEEIDAIVEELNERQDTAIPTFDTPLTYQARCGARDCESLVGMSDHYCSACGTQIDWPAPSESTETGDDVPRKLLTGGDR